MFKYATVKLSEIIVQALKQNQTMTDIEQTYFEEESEEEAADPRALADPAQAVKVVAKFKDFSKRRRPVSHVSWQKQAPVLAVSHCSPGGTMAMSLVASY